MKTTPLAFTPFSPERFVDCEIEFKLLDVNAKDNATATATQYDVAQLNQLLDEKTSTEKYASLEPNSWLLGGGFKIMPDDATEAQTGVWSKLSGEDGTFSAIPTLDFYFGGIAISTIGFTLYFDTSAGVPSKIRITTYAADQATVIDSEEFTNSGSFFVADMPVQNYYRVLFEFLETVPAQRRVRVLECKFGIVQIFNKSTLESVNINYAANMTAESFPSRQLVFSFNNLDKKYNLINPNGLYAYLQEGQDINAVIKINGDPVEMGTFEYTSASSADDDIVGQIVANDCVLSSMDEVVVVGEYTIKTLSQAVADVLGDLDVSVSMKYPSLGVVDAYPEKTTRREALRLLAQACCCSIWIDRDGVLQIQPLDVGTPNDELTASRMPSMGGISVSEPVDSVVLTAKNETTGAEYTYTSGVGKRIKTINNPCVLPANGQSVADWLLLQHNRRVKYNKPNRCNPATEIGDTLTIYDAYGENRDAAVNEISITFDSNGLSAVTKAISP